MGGILENETDTFFHIWDPYYTTRAGICTAPSMYYFREMHMDSVGSVTKVFGSKLRT